MLYCVLFYLYYLLLLYFYFYDFFLNILELWLFDSANVKPRDVKLADTELQLYWHNIFKREKVKLKKLLKIQKNKKDKWIQLFLK